MAHLSPLQRHNLPGGSVLVYARADAERIAARRIADLIQAQIHSRGRAVLGLATGSTPIAVYNHLVSWHEAGELTFDQVTTYNLDEYYPISPTDPNSYRCFMDRHLFGRVGLPPNQTHLLDGTIAPVYADAHTREFDRWIAADGGLDLQLLGLGRNGHIGFNEPTDLAVAAALTLPTRMVELHPTTRADAVKDFGDPAAVPGRALTVGIATILAARSILILAFGAAKAEAVARSLQGPMTAAVPGSLLQAVAPRVTWLIDPEAAALLI